MDIVRYCTHSYALRNYLYLLPLLVIFITEFMSIYIKVLTQNRRVFLWFFKVYARQFNCSDFKLFAYMRNTQKKNIGGIGLNTLQFRHTRNSGLLTDSKSINSKLLRGGNISFACLLLMRLHEIGFLQE